MFLYRTPWLLEKLYPQLVWKIPVSQKTIFLTFDDGPVPVATDFVLDQLGAFKAFATFFCVGENISKHPRVFQRIIKEGHLTANHTFNHLNGWKTTQEQYLKNVETCQQHLPTSNPKFFRPPYGRIRREQIRALLPGYKIIMWSLLTGDFDPKQSPENCLAVSLKYTYSGSIVVFHDSLKTLSKLKEVLPAYLEYFTSRGYSFEKLPVLPLAESLPRSNYST